MVEAKGKFRFHFGSIGVILRGFDQPRSLVMIVLAAALMMAAPALPAPPAAERKAYGSCLAKFRTARMNDKLGADAYKKAAQTACATQEAAFRTAWINYDVAMKTRRSEAEENAAQQVEDYLQNSTEDYVQSTTPVGDKAHGDSAVKPAAATTPPKP
jgi:hypothetical protein